MQDGNNGEILYAHYVLHQFHMLPSTFSDLPIREKAMVMAFIDEKVKSDKKEASKIKRR